MDFLDELKVRLAQCIKPDLGIPLIEWLSLLIEVGNALVGSSYKSPILNPMGEPLFQFVKGKV